MKKEEKIMWDIYRELYLNAIPSADFDELVTNAELNEFGQKDVHFMDYEISREKQDEIIEKHLKKSRVNVYMRKAITAAILLGCSPKTKI